MCVYIHTFIHTHINIYTQIQRYTYTRTHTHIFIADIWLTYLFFCKLDCTYMQTFRFHICSELNEMWRWVSMLLVLEWAGLMCSQQTASDPSSARLNWAPRFVQSEYTCRMVTFTSLCCTAGHWTEVTVVVIINIWMYMATHTCTCHARVCAL